MKIPCHLYPLTRVGRFTRETDPAFSARASAESAENLCGDLVVWNLSS